MDHNSFISYQEALRIVFEKSATLSNEIVPIEHAYGRVLAENLFADRDFPPFDRVTMDGIAIRFDQYVDGKREFPVEKVLPAGEPQYELRNPEYCVEIMTGATLPVNADTIIRYEDLEIDGTTAIIKNEEVLKGQNIHRLGQDHRKKDLLVEKGVKIGPAEVSVAATIGKDQLKVVKPLKTIIISTGDELVPIDQDPRPHQIRRSNSFMLQAILNQAGWKSDLTHIPDEKSIMKSLLEKIFREYELLLFSGAVSKGKFDFLPEVLKEIGVNEHFHRVRQRPGKPFWFGTTAYNHFVFAFPGNPVSSFMCSYAYLLPWIHESSHLNKPIQSARLAIDVKFDKSLTLFLQAKSTVDEQGIIWAHPIKSHGSGDFVNLVNGNGILILPEKESLFKAGEIYPFITYRK